MCPVNSPDCKKLIIVLKPYHIIENSVLNVTALGNGRLFKISLGTDVTNDPLAIEAFLETTKCPFYGFAFLYNYFYCHKWGGGFGLPRLRQTFFKKNYILKKRNNSVLARRYNYHPSLHNKVKKYGAG
jgi:hypothetical protein